MDVILSLDEAFELAKTCLLKNGFDTENAQAIASRLIEAERDHCHSHGLFRLPLTIKGIEVGRVNGKSRPTSKQLAPAVIQVDGDSGYAPLSQKFAHPLLVECAKQNGIAALAITNTFHLAAMWPEVEALAMEGLCAFAFTQSYPYVAPAGGTRPLFGTNPMGFAWPRPKGPHLVFDQASSAMARGDIMLHARDGKPVPDNVGIDAGGVPTNSPDKILEGAQLGFGGYKGASLGLMIELLAGPLMGEFLSFEAHEDDAGKGGPPKGGELMIVIDPKKFGNEDGFLDHGEKLFAEILKQDGTRLPSQRRFDAREDTLNNGIKVHPVLYAQILELSK